MKTNPGRKFSLKDPMYNQNGLELDSDDLEESLPGVGTQSIPMDRNVGAWPPKKPQKKLKIRDLSDENDDELTEYGETSVGNRTTPTKTRGDNPISAMTESVNIPEDIKSLVNKHDKNEIKAGFEVEKEHNKGSTDVVNSWLDLLKITLAHLEEDPKYYTHLKSMEDKYKKEGLTEAPHIQTAASSTGVFDIELETGVIALKKLIEAILGKQVKDKYGSVLKLKNRNEREAFIEELMKNPQIRSYIS